MEVRRMRLIGDVMITFRSKRQSRKRKAPPIREAQWEQKKPYIEQLYMIENLTLSEVLRRMEKDHEFFAT
jgi:hypothetical protein